MIRVAVSLVISFIFSPLLAAGTPPVDKHEYRWPPAPAKARYAFIKDIRGEPDEKDEGFWSGLSALLFGEEQKRHFIRPHDIAITSSGQIAVADPGAQGIHIFDQENDEYAFIQQAGEHRLVSPVGVAFTDLGELVLTDSSTGMIHMLSSDGELIRQKKEEKLKRPTGVAVHPVTHEIYVVDTVSHRIFVFDENLNRKKVIGRRGNQLGEFNFPTHLAFSPKGVLYVTDSMNFRIQVFDKFGVVKSQFGRHGDRLGEFSKPKGIAIDGDGHIYIMEAHYDHLLIYDDQGRFLLPIGGTGSEPGRFSLPGGVAVLGDTIYIVDSYNQRVQLLKKL